MPFAHTSHDAGEVYTTPPSGVFVWFTFPDGTEGRMLLTDLIAATTGAAAAFDNEGTDIEATTVAGALAELAARAPAEEP